MGTRQDRAHCCKATLAATTKYRTLYLAVYCPAVSKSPVWGQTNTGINLKGIPQLLLRPDVVVEPVFCVLHPTNYQVATTGCQARHSTPKLTKIDAYQNIIVLAVPRITQVARCTAAKGPRKKIFWCGATYYQADRKQTYLGHKRFFTKHRLRYSPF